MILRRRFCQLVSLRLGPDYITVRAEYGSELGAGAATEDRAKTGVKAETGTTAVVGYGACG